MTSYTILLYNKFIKSSTIVVNNTVNLERCFMKSYYNFIFVVCGEAINLTYFKKEFIPIVIIKTVTDTKAVKPPGATFRW